MQELESRVQRLEDRAEGFERTTTERIIRMEIAVEELKGLRTWTEGKLDDMRDEITQMLERKQAEQHRITQNRLVFAGVAIAAIGLVINNVLQHVLR